MVTTLAEIALQMRAFASPSGVVSTVLPLLHASGIVLACLVVNLAMITVSTPPKHE